MFICVFIFIIILVLNFIIVKDAERQYKSCKSQYYIKKRDYEDKVYNARKSGSGGYAMVYKITTM